MPSLEEATNSGSQLEAALRAGIRSIDRDQLVTFRRYTRTVLPLDGYVFWLATADKVKVPGALHYAVDLRQDEDETIAVNRVVFSSEQEVQAFNAVTPNSIWIGDLGPAAAYHQSPTEPDIGHVEPGPVLFAFSSRGPFFRKADVFHYVGIAVQPPMLSQIVNSAAQLPTQAVVSDSLPAWLSLATYSPIWLAPANPGITLYPSFAVPDNLPPPYGSVHIEPSGIRALQAAPYRDQNTSHYQLTAERVRVTLYGCQNSAALDFVDLVMNFIRDTDTIGLMGMPTVRDEKRTQIELGILAQKKTIDFEVSYVQTRINTIARQMIEVAIASFIPNPYDLI